MQPDLNSAKGAQVGGNWQYEPLMQAVNQVRQLVKKLNKPTARFRAGSPMGIDLIGGPMTDIMPPSQEGYGPGGIIRTIPTAQERL
jgi:hypothetical protein